MEKSNDFVIEFQSIYCKKKEHNDCSNKWTGMGFIVTCTCNCHKEIDEKNMLLEGHSKSSNPDHRPTLFRTEVMNYD
jgi:hypothetical protein